MLRYLFFAFLLPLFLPNSSFAHPSAKGHMHTNFSVKRIFINDNCVAANTCDLKEFTIIIEDYEVWFSDYDQYPSYGTSMIAEMETASVPDLENYVFVQFIKGCVFNSIRNSDGTVQAYFGYVIEHFGEKKTFCFQEWVIDSFDQDPVYRSDPELGRFYYWRWNTKSGSFDWRTHKFYGEEKPNYPRIYITDLPNGGSFTGESAGNASLEFKTCIYRAKDVPYFTNPENLDFAKPLYCFDWRTSYIYNWGAGKFESKNEIDPFCLQKPSD